MKLPRLSPYPFTRRSPKDAIPEAVLTQVYGQIDNLVYRLYNLTYDEVKVIEPEFPVGKAEWEGKGVQKCITH